MNLRSLSRTGFQGIALAGFVSLSGPLAGATHDDFDDNGVADTPSTLTQRNSTPGPTVLGGGIDGNYLNLMTVVNDQNNEIAYDLSDPGEWSVIDATFDFRTMGDADGFCFLLAPTAAFFDFGEGVPLGTGGYPVAEEPSVAGAFALAFDIYPGINEFSAHWDGDVHSANNVNPDTGADINAGLWHQANIRVEQIGNASNVVVSVDPDVEFGGGFPVEVLKTVLPNMLPYENRVQFSGRTGGASMDVDLDNIDVEYTNAFDPGGLPSVTPTGLFQDFDSLGGTGYTARQHASTDLDFTRPGPYLLPADDGSDGVFLRLVEDTINGHNNTIAFDRALDGGVTISPQTLSFDFRMLNEDGADPADGFGLYLLSTTTYGLRGGGVGGLAFEQSGVADSLHVGFDVYPAGTNDIVLSADAIEIGRYPIDPGLLSFVSDTTDGSAGMFHGVDLRIVPGETGLVLTLTLTPDVNGTPGDPVLAFENVEVPGLGSTDYRVQFGGRTGGLNLTVDLDNIMSTTEAAPQTEFVRQDFEGAGTGFLTTAEGTGWAPAFATVADSTVLRLVHDGQNSSVNTIAFDQAETGELGGAQAVIADFDFRVDSADDPADGFSLRFLPTDVYGTSGPGAGFMGNPGNAEEPNLPGILAIGFDVYPNATQNDVSVHWDGTELVNVTIDPGVIDLADGQWHHARVIWLPAAGGSEVTVIIDDSETIADALAIPGLDLYPYRCEFAGRTGGLNMTIDLDNIVVADEDRVNEDSDGDMLPNLWEIANMLDPFDATGVNGADGDPDEDDSPNSQELARDTNPQDPDHDDDGVRDGAETGDGNFVSLDATGTDPKNPDTDGDRLLDGVENPLLPWDPDNAAMQPGSNPNDADTDDDGFNDGPEVAYGSDPTSAASRPQLPAGTLLAEDFDVFSFMSVYEFTNSGGDPAGIIDSGGPHGQVLRLTRLTGGNLNNAAWDYVPLERSPLEISFEYRMSADQGGNAADGIGVGLFDTLMWGEIGAINVLTGGAVYEDPRTGAGFPSALYVGFDIYPGDPDGNNVRITGPGGSGDLVGDVIAPFPLNDNRWHGVRILLESDGAGGALLTLILIEDIDEVTGPPIEHELFAEATVFGFDPATFTGRLIMGGRTGGAFVDSWIDNIRIGSIAGSGGDLRITEITYDQTAGEVGLTWLSEPGATYSIESSTTLQPPWIEVDDGVASQGATTTVNGIAVFPVGAERIYYRVRKQ